MRRVNVHEAKTQLSKLLEQVEAGERIVIARAGEPVAVLTPYRAAVRKRRLGLFAGQATISPDFDVLPPELGEIFADASR
jgi:prevent-host-death family protein